MQELHVYILCLKKHRHTPLGIELGAVFGAEKSLEIITTGGSLGQIPRASLAPGSLPPCRYLPRLRVLLSCVECDDSLTVFC